MGLPKPATELSIGFVSLTEAFDMTTLQLRAPANKRHLTPRQPLANGWADLEPVINFGAVSVASESGADEAEFAAHGGTMRKNDNEVWHAFRRNPEGRGQFSRLRCRSSLEDSRYSSLLAPRIQKNWLPAMTAPKSITGSSACHQLESFNSCSCNTLARLAA
jgi:hypothetical protein